MDRDVSDHVRFCPVQSALGQKMLTDHGAPRDVSTAVLIDEAGVHTESTAILRLLPWMGPAWAGFGRVALLVPECVRNSGYRAFARNRGPIWATVKRLMGWGDTMLEDHRDKVVGLEAPLPSGWGFAPESEQSR